VLLKAAPAGFQQKLFFEQKGLRYKRMPPLAITKQSLWNKLLKISLIINLSFLNIPQNYFMNL